MVQAGRLFSKFNSSSSMLRHRESSTPSPQRESTTLSMAHTAFPPNSTPDFCDPMCRGPGKHKKPLKDCALAQFGRSSSAGWRPMDGKVRHGTGLVDLLAQKGAWKGSPRLCICVRHYRGAKWNRWHVNDDCIAAMHGAMYRLS